MLPEKTYIIRIIHLESHKVQQIEFTKEVDALPAYELFSDPAVSADIYESVSLIEFDWKTKNENQMKYICFEEGETAL